MMGRNYAFRPILVTLLEYKKLESLEKSINFEGKNVITNALESEQLFK